MKRSSRICLITLAAAMLAISARAGSLRSDTGSACLWRFDGSLDDDAGQVRDTLTAVGGQPRFISASELPGVSGRALALGVQPGDAQYLVAPISSDLQLGASYTIEAWIHPTAISGWNRLVLRWGKAPDYAYHLAIHNGVVSLCHGQSDGRYIFAEGGQVEAGRWHHLVGVARQNVLEVYLDGRLAGSAPFDGSFNNPAGERLGIGDSAGIPGANSRFRGYLDELAIWKHALSPAEISSHYTARTKVLRELEIARRKADFAARRETFERLTKSGVEEIVFAERRASPEHYYANFGGTCTDDDDWKHGPDGGRLCKLNLRTGELTVLVDDPAGAVRDPQVHYNGRTILFAYRKGGTHHYNLHTINADGSGLRAITNGSWDDIEPCWLPDGGIVFSSSRCKRYVACWYTQVAVLFRCDADGGNLRMLSSNAVHENTPCVLPDGRILYTRWEYVNRDAVVFHHLWTMNPDGSGQQVFYGNLTPGGVFIDAQPIPGSDRVVFTLSPGHGRMEHAGRIAIVTGAGGPNASNSLRLISKTADFRDPFPVSPGEFLVARNNQLLLLNEAGEESVLCAAPMMVHEPRPLRARSREPVLAPASDLSQAKATLFIQNVGEGRNMAGVRPGQVKKLLVLEDLPKPANFHGGGSTPVGIGVTSTLKRILGTVPVEADGSASFQVPPMRSLYFALLDEQDLSIKQMRSFVTLQPGETRSCVGCHDTRTQSPLTAPAMPVAAQRAPSRIEPVAGVPEILDFPRDIQPILDRHCTRCHNPDRRDGGMVLTGDRGPVYSLSYFDLFLHWQIKDTRDEPRSGTGRQPGDDPPFATFSSASPLMQMIGGRHYDAKLSAAEIALVRLWIDTAAQYAGTYAAFGSGQIGGWWRNNEPIREMADAWPGTPHAREAVERRCGACHGDALPRFVTDQVKVDVYADMESWQRPLTRYSRHRIFNLSRPEKSLVLLAPLAREAGGYAHGAASQQPTRVVEDCSRPPQPVTHPVIFADTHDADYAKILAHIEAAKARLEEIKRFDMAGFKPNAQYVRELKRYGVLPASFDLAHDPINVYAADEAYWRSMWHRPPPSAVK